MTQRIRPGDTGDAHAIAEVHVAGWKQGYQGLLDQAYLDSLDVADRTRRWIDILHGPEKVLVHEDGGHVNAFATFGLSHDVDLPEAAGEVYGLYVHPKAWGQGIGGALLTTVVAQLLAGKQVLAPDDAPGTESMQSPSSEATPLVLWTLQGNRRARRFYERQGWVADGTTRQDQRSGLGKAPDVTFTEVRYLLSQ